MQVLTCTGTWPSIKQVTTSSSSKGFEPYVSGGVLEKTRVLFLSELEYHLLAKVGICHQKALQPFKRKRVVFVGLAVNVNLV